MNTYARVYNGLVAELFATADDIADLFHPELVWVDVTAVTPQPQQNWLASEIAGTWSFTAPQAAAAPTPAQLAMQALSAGLKISSTSTPALDGTYAVDQLSQMDIIAIETSLNAGRGFPGGATTFNYQDVTGTMHAFSESNFTDLAAAVRDFVYGCRSVIGGSSTNLPVAAVKIA